MGAGVVTAPDAPRDVPTEALQARLAALMAKADKQGGIVLSGDDIRDLFTMVLSECSDRVVAARQAALDDVRQGIAALISIRVETGPILLEQEDLLFRDAVLSVLDRLSGSRQGER